MSIANCSRCNRYVDTDHDEMETLDGEEVCLRCFDENEEKKNPAAVALGSIKSTKKAEASRKNGKKGGRPRNV